MEVDDLPSLDLENKTNNADKEQRFLTLTSKVLEIVQRILETF